MEAIKNKDFYQLTAKTPTGDVIPFSDFKGKTVLIVNTATKCGLAPQFKGLEDLHQKYQDKGLVIIGFPCNQFLSQEPETNDSMVESCQINFGVTFQLTEKCDVNGSNTHPVFKYLKKKLGGWFGSKIKWNFTKFLIDKNGNPVKRYAPTVKPNDMEQDILGIL
jgi:glutathione peroxidase